MAHMVKCAICGVQFNRDIVQAVKHSAARYSHYKCEPDKELVPLPEVSKDTKELQELKDYIKELYKDKCNWALVNKQIKDFHSNKGYTYKGMINTLYWFYGVQKNSVEKSNGGIGIIPFAYNDAKNYFYNLYAANQKNADKDINNYLPKERIVIIQNPRSETPFVKLFDMDWEEEE